MRRWVHASRVRACGLLSLILALAPWTAFAQISAYQEGINYFQGGHYRWALEKFIEAVDRSPRDPERRWFLAETYLQLGDTDAAAHAYRQILHMAPQSPQAEAARQALGRLGEPGIATIRVAFQRRGTAILIPARVNGQPIGYFILDTGATFTSVSRQAADVLGLRSRDGSVRLATASGVVQAPLTVLDEVDIGGATARHVAGVIHDLPGVPPGIVGLLGLSFLERFRVSLDITQGVLVLETGN
jgi:clan AA aspartic protease (TIGR02281 family)